LECWQGQAWSAEQGRDKWPVREINSSPSFQCTHSRIVRDQEEKVHRSCTWGLQAWPFLLLPQNITVLIQSSRVQIHNLCEVTCNTIVRYMLNVYWRKLLPVCH
jgi:hypothetical protein